MLTHLLTLLDFKEYLCKKKKMCTLTFLDPFSVYEEDLPSSHWAGAGDWQMRTISRAWFATMCMYKVSNVDCPLSSTLDIMVKQMNEMHTLPLIHHGSGREKWVPSADCSRKRRAWKPLFLSSSVWKASGKQSKVPGRTFQEWTSVRNPALCRVSTAGSLANFLIRFFTRQ